MADIKKRLQDSLDTCLKNYEAWDSKKGDSKLREELQDSIHEMRKAVSRLEINIAVSERDNISDNPIPIPPHRSSAKEKGAVESILPDTNSTGNKKDNGGNGGARRSKGGRRSGSKK
jgi:hypothetical protein